MKFSENQQKIIRQISLGKIISLESFISEYLLTRNFITKVEYTARHDRRIVLFDIRGNNILGEFNEFIRLCMFLIKNDIIYTNRIEPYLYEFYTKETNEDAVHLNPILNELTKEIINYKFIISIHCDQFIQNGFRTNEEIALDDERKRGEKSLFWTRWAVVIAAVGMLASAIFNYASLRININNSHVVHDTVKVMYYNPPKDTTIIKQK